MSYFKQMKLELYWMLLIFCDHTILFKLLYLSIIKSVDDQMHDVYGTLLRNIFISME